MPKDICEKKGKCPQYTYYMCKENIVPTDRIQRESEVFRRIETNDNNLDEVIPKEGTFYIRLSSAGNFKSEDVVEIYEHNKACVGKFRIVTKKSDMYLELIRI